MWYVLVNHELKRVEMRDYYGQIDLTGIQLFDTYNAAENAAYQLAEQYGYKLDIEAIPF